MDATEMQQRGWSDTVGGVVQLYMAVRGGFLQLFLKNLHLRGKEVGATL